MVGACEGKVKDLFGGHGECVWDVFVVHFEGVFIAQCIVSFAVYQLNLECLFEISKTKRSDVSLGIDFQCFFVFNRSNECLSKLTRLRERACWNGKQCVKKKITTEFGSLRERRPCVLQHTCKCTSRVVKCSTSRRFA